MNTKFEQLFQRQSQATDLASLPTALQEKIKTLCETWFELGAESVEVVPVTTSQSPQQQTPDLKQYTLALLERIYEELEQNMNIYKNQSSQSILNRFIPGKIEAYQEVLNFIEEIHKEIER